MNTDSSTNMQHVFEGAARYFSVLSESARLKILHSICSEERSVNSIIAITGLAQANVSRHLGLMYQVGMLSRRRQGNQVFYKVADQMFVDLCRIVSTHIDRRLGQDTGSADYFGTPDSPPVALNATDLFANPSREKETTSV